MVTRLSTMYIVQFTLYSIQCIQYIVKFTPRYDSLILAKHFDISKFLPTNTHTTSTQSTTTIMVSSIYIYIYIYIPIGYNAIL